MHQLLRPIKTQINISMPVEYYEPDLNVSIFFAKSHKPKPPSPIQEEDPLPVIEATSGSLSFLWKNPFFETLHAIFLFGFDAVKAGTRNCRCLT
jgi:hypothetical protein